MPNPPILSHPQMATLDKLDESCKVVGVYDGTPLIEQDGRIVRLQGNGRRVAAPAVACESLATREIDKVAPRVWDSADKLPETEPFDF